MPGGPGAYERVRRIFEAAAARVDGEPCVAYLGPGSAGHYVKMVHNGIEYGLMQLIAESYDLMKRGLGLSDEELHEVYADWNQKELNSYLIEITADIFRSKTTDRQAPDRRDPRRGQAEGHRQVDLAGRHGLQVPVPTIDAAVAMRDLSDLQSGKGSRQRLAARPGACHPGRRTAFVERLGNALLAGMILTFAQGMAQLKAASKAYDYDLKLEDVARIWRGGCIIRAALLEDIRSAYHARPDLPNLCVGPQAGWRSLASPIGPARDRRSRRGRRHPRAGLDGLPRLSSTAIAAPICPPT